MATYGIDPFVFFSGESVERKVCLKRAFFQKYLEENTLSEGTAIKLYQRIVINIAQQWNGVRYEQCAEDLVIFLFEENLLPEPVIAFYKNLIPGIERSHEIIKKAAVLKKIHGL